MSDETCGCPSAASEAAASEAADSSANQKAEGPSSGRDDARPQDAGRPCCRRRGGGGGALVEPAALAALLSAGAYGYDMRRTILEKTDGQVDVDVGGLYRALRRLEEDGAVVSRWGDDEAGPRRREYELTEQGVFLAEHWVEALRMRERLSGLLAGLLEDGLAQARGKDA